MSTGELNTWVLLARGAPTYHLITIGSNMATVITIANIETTAWRPPYLANEILWRLRQMKHKSVAARQSQFARTPLPSKASKRQKLSLLLLLSRAPPLAKKIRRKITSLGRSIRLWPWISTISRTGRISWCSVSWSFLFNLQMFIDLLAVVQVPLELILAMSFLYVVLGWRSVFCVFYQPLCVDVRFSL